MDVEGFYEHAVAAGYAYGPSFQGLRAVWRDGADLLAEVALPEAAGDADGFGIHPALLDAALHPMLLAADAESADDDGMRLPFAWNGVSLWAAEATTVRVRLSPRQPSPDQDGAVAEGGLRVVVADAMGAPVLTVDSLTMRPADPRQLRVRGTDVASMGCSHWTGSRCPTCRSWTPPTPWAGSCWAMTPFTWPRSPDSVMGEWCAIRVSKPWSPRSMTERLLPPSP
ncbi:Phenolphthiocerol synthesis polyketide synthase type I Pks15/1 [Streptomyces antimycoticus]